MTRQTTLKEVMDARDVKSVEKNFLAHAKPSRKLYDYIFKFSFDEQWGVSAVAEETALQPFIATIHQVGEPGFIDPSEAKDWNEVARMKGFFLHPTTFNDREVNKDILFDAFDSVDQNVFSMYEAINAHDPYLPSNQLVSALGNNLYAGSSMFILELESNVRWRGTKAAGALLAYSLYRYSCGAKWGVLRPCPIYREASGAPSTEERTQQEIDLAVAKLETYYQSFGFVKVPETEYMAISFIDLHFKQWKKYLNDTLAGRREIVSKTNS